MADKQKELLAKYSRVAEDKSQLQNFTKDVIIGEIGGGGGSSGPVLYKHNVSLYLSFDNPDDALVTLNFLSKYDNFNATSLLGLLEAMRSLGDTQAMLNPIIDDNDGNVFFISNIATSSDGTKLEFIATLRSGNVALPARFEGANENITDTVEPYIEVSGGGGSGGQIKTINLNDYTSDQTLFILLDPIIKFDETGTTISQVVNIQDLPIDWENDDIVKLTYTVNEISGEMIMRKAVSVNGLKSYQCSSSYISRNYGICLVSMCLATPYGDTSSFEVLMVSTTPLPNMPE